MKKRGNSQTRGSFLEAAVCQHRKRLILDCLSIGQTQEKANKTQPNQTPAYPRALQKSSQKQNKLFKNGEDTCLIY